jgi:tetratricopeptide (TPR) repeat protein
MPYLRQHRQHLLYLALTIAGLLLAAGIYLPGISGPYVFDDSSNLLTNDYLKITSLDLNSLKHAAYSLYAGPLQRPIAMVSFALNYYFAHGFQSSTPFKVTNLGIHVLNGVLVFWLVQLLLVRLTIVSPDGWSSLKNNRHALNLLAGGMALMWVTSPIQLTSVLYVVQRMVSLSALFTLLGLICYLKGRARMAAGQPGGGWLIAFGLVGCGALGVLSKENAILLPLFILPLEITLFHNEWPLSGWQRLSPRTKHVLILTSFLILSICFGWALQYALHGYGTRHFTLSERVLTEARVLWFYLSLIVAPRLDQFGMNHDDIALSTSFFVPWTTIPSVFGITGLLILGISTWKKYPLLSIGILWFFIGHLLESTIFALEIAHEHRNYLPSLGVFLALTHLINEGSRKLRNEKLWLLLPLFVVVFVAITTMRSMQWSDIYTYAQYEAIHHPRSARAQTYLGWALAEQRQYSQALEATRKAAAIDPYDPVYLINMHLISAKSGIKLTSDERADVIRRLTTRPLTPSALLALQNIDTCLLGGCTRMQKDVERWMRALLAPGSVKGDRSYYYYLLGRSLSGQNRIKEALTALRRSYEIDPRFLHPRFEIVQIFIRQKNIAAAEHELSELRKANMRNPYPRDSEIASLAEKIAQLKAVTTRDDSQIEKTRIVKEKHLKAGSPGIIDN